MPLISHEAALAARGQTLPAQTQAADIEQPDGSALDLAAAALRQNNVIANAPRLLADAADSFDDVYDPNFDPLADSELAGYELHADRFIGSNSRAESQRIKNRIAQEMADREVIHQAGGAGLAASIAAGLIDPVTLASMAVPLLGSGPRMMRIAKGVTSSIALDSAQEALLHAEQSLRTAGESVINVAAGALLTGALGGLATRVPKAEFQAMQAAAKAHTDAMAPHLEVESTGGAARVGFGTTLEDETVAKGGETILKSLGKINPLARTMNSMSKRARILMQEIADVPFLLNKHLQGVATPRSAEGEILAEQAQRYRLVKETDAAWTAHKAAGGAMSRQRFSEELAGALRRGDVSMDPHIQKLTASYRKYFDDSLKQLKAAKLVPEEAGAQFAMSYLPRLYDHAKIRANRIAFEDALADWFSRSGDVEAAEIRTAVADVIDTVNGSLRGHAQIAQGFVGKTGSLQARTLNVPDEVLEPWLVNDVDKILESYVRSVTPQLVLKRKFGDMDMKQQMQDVRDEYVAMRERAKSNEAKARITDEMERTLDDIQSVRDILLGKFAKPANPDSVLVRTGRLFRAWNYVRLLGGQVMSSFPDAGRVVSRHGLVKTGAMVARLVTDSGLRNLTKNEAHRVGTALEYVLNTRADTLADIGDEMASSKLDRIVRRESNRFSRITGMASWNSALKTLAVALEQDAIVRAARGGKLSKFQRGQLASLGIGDRMLERIRKELEGHATGSRMSDDVGDPFDPPTKEEQQAMMEEAAQDPHTIAERNAELQALEQMAGAELSKVVRFDFSAEKDLKAIMALMKKAAKRPDGTVSPEDVRNIVDKVIGKEPTAKPPMAAKNLEKPPDADGMFRANTQAWQDREAAEAFEAALLKSSNQLVLTKGAADTPLFMSKEIGKTLFQFKSFGMAAVNRLLIPMAQGVAHGDLATLNGAWMMMAIGALANAARDSAAGFKPSTDPARIAIEAFDRAGFTSFLAEPFDILSGTMGGPRFGRFTSQDVVETVAGPTFGTAEDIRKTLQGMFTEGGNFDPQIKANDIYRFRKLLPYQNLFFLRRLVNMLEGEFSEAIGAEGAGAKSAVERATESKTLQR
jgi:hypothetical protein